MHSKKKKLPLRETLCAGFCVYFKPGKSEELACRGYTIVEKLLRNGRVTELRKSNAGVAPETREKVVQSLCRACDFQRDGCDFMLDRQARPCGGFIFLASLVQAGLITVENLA